MIIKREAELIYDRFLPLYIWSYTEKKAFRLFSIAFLPPWKLNLV
jgi:hypothetical protein